MHHAKVLLIYQSVESDGIMVNQFHLVTSQSEHGRKLITILKNRYPLAPVLIIKKALKDRDIKINGARVSEDIKLNAGDEVVWYSLWNEPEIPLIFEDENIIIINKPAGISTDQQADGAMSIESWALPRGGVIVHRLDQQTSGLLILSKNETIKKTLENALKHRNIIKHYECLVYGIPLSRHAVLQDFLVKDAKRNTVSISKTANEFAKEIITEYHLMESRGDCSLLFVTLHTGRTHQIRAHLAFCGYPILGDDKYGFREINRKLKMKRLMLCATGLEFLASNELSYLFGKKFEIHPPFSLYERE